MSQQLLYQLSCTTTGIAGTNVGKLDGTQLGKLAISDVAQSGGIVGIEAIVIRATLASVNGGTLDVVLENSIDGGTTWDEWIHWTQFTAGAGTTKNYRSSHSIYNADGITDLGVALAANSKRDGVFGPQFRIKTIEGAGVSSTAAQLIKIYGSGA